MALERVETKERHCQKCSWCDKLDDYNVLANTHTPIYFCVVGDFYSRRSPDKKPTFEKNCPCFEKPDNEGEED